MFPCFNNQEILNLPIEQSVENYLLDMVKLMILMTTLKKEAQSNQQNPDDRFQQYYYLPYLE